MDRLSLQIGDGEFMVLVVPSGCGKSTALRSIAGLGDYLRPDQHRRVVNLPPEDRDPAMVFQELLAVSAHDGGAEPSVGLQQRKLRTDQIQRRVREVAAMLGIEEYLRRKPAALSGGQRQRVAMCRAIVREPRAFLMVEPLSNLDAKLRVSMRTSLAQLHERLGVTTVTPASGTPL